MRRPDAWGGSRRGLALRACLAGWLVLLGLLHGATAGHHVLAVRSLTPAARPLSIGDLRQQVVALQMEAGQSAVLTSGQHALYARQLASIAGSLSSILSLQRQITDRRALLGMLEEQRALAAADLDQLGLSVRGDLSDYTSTVIQATGPISVTAGTLQVSATVDLPAAQLALQVHAARLALDVHTDAQVLGLLAVQTRTQIDARRLALRLSALLRDVHLGVIAVLHDLRVVRQSDPRAAGDAAGGLAAGLNAALVHLNDTLLGTLDLRLSMERLRIDQAQARLAAQLARAAVAFGGTQSAVLAAEITAAPLTGAQKRDVATGTGGVAMAVRDAAAAGKLLVSRVADLYAVQDAQAGIDREVRKAQQDLDTDLARTDAALQGRLRSDVTVAIGDTQQTVHVHLDAITVGSLVRDLDFNVGLGLSVLQIATLHAAVTPSTHGYQGQSASRISGVDLVLQARLHDLKAHIRTDVAGIKAQQAALSTAVRARVAALRATLRSVLAPLVARYQQDVAALDGRVSVDLSIVRQGVDAAHGRLAAVSYLKPLTGRVLGGATVPLRHTPSFSSARPVIAWARPGTTLRLVGYVWGWAASDLRTGLLTTRWYVVGPPDAHNHYLYIPAARLEIVHGGW